MAEDGQKVFVGIDVGRDRPLGRHFTVANDPAGLAGLATRLEAARPSLIVLEASAATSARPRSP